MNNIHQYLVWFALCCNALLAGTFFAFSNFIMQALGKRPASEAMAVMQMINKTVINPIFMLAFLGSAVICIYLAIYSIINWQDKRMVYVLIAALVYVLGAFLVTMLFNVPLNNALEAADPLSPDGQLLWSQYLRSWTFWNSVRAIGCLVSMILFVLSLLKQPA